MGVFFSARTADEMLFTQTLLECRSLILSSRIPKTARFVRVWGRPVAGILGLALVMLGAAPLHAQSEDEIKAAFLLNFARYVEWPESAFSDSDAPVRICMLGSDGFDRVAADIVEGKTVGPRPVEVVAVAGAKAATSCHILFVESSSISTRDVVASLRQASVFTVGSDEGFAKQGGIANFYRAGKRIRFEINPGAAEGAGLKISSRLLRLAQLVE
jgi:hypothetical protein